MDFLAGHISIVMNTHDFEVLYAAEYGYVERTLRRLGTPARDLADLAHDVFIIIYRRWDDRRPERPLRAWLFGIALRVAANYRNRAANSREHGVPDARAADRAAPIDEQVADVQARTQLLIALETLDLEQRAVVVLHDIEGQKAADIAETLSIPLSTVYSRLRAARLKVIAAVRQQGVKR